MVFQDMKMKNYILLSRLANLGLNMLKCSKNKVLNKKEYLKPLKYIGIYIHYLKTGFNTL